MQDLEVTDDIHDPPICLVEGVRHSHEALSLANLKQDSRSTDFSHSTSESTSAASSPRSRSPSSSPTVSTSSPPTGYAIDWYDDGNGTSDEELLEEFFRQNPRLAAQVSRMKTYKGRRQTDAELILNYKFALEIYKLLMEKKWEVRLVVCILDL